MSCLSVPHPPRVSLSLQLGVALTCPPTTLALRLDRSRGVRRSRRKGIFPGERLQQGMIMRHEAPNCDDRVLVDSGKKQSQSLVAFKSPKKTGMGTHCCMLGVLGGWGTKVCGPSSRASLRSWRLRMQRCFLQWANNKKGRGCPLANCTKRDSTLRVRRTDGAMEQITPRLLKPGPRTCRPSASFNLNLKPPSKDFGRWVAVLVVPCIQPKAKPCQSSTSETLTCYSPHYSELEALSAGVPESSHGTRERRLLARQVLFERHDGDLNPQAQHDQDREQYDL
jgi:hypothetical protein